MKLSNHSIVLMLLGVVVLAGCVGQPTAPSAGVGGTAGVVIKSLQVAPTQTYSGSTVIITADIQNVGATDASNLKVFLYGLEFPWTCQSPTTLPPILSGANPSLGVTQGAETFVTWSCTTPPSSSVSNVIPYTFTVRVSYNYSTTLDAVLKAVDVNYFRQTNTPGGVASSSFTSGPLSVTVNAPTVISTGTSVPIQFVITNTGGGRVGDPSTTGAQSTLDKITTVTATSPLTGCPANAFLGGGSKTIISCNVNTAGIQAGGYGNINVHLVLGYNYFVDAAQTVTVLPILGTSAGNITSSGSGSCGTSGQPVCTGQTLCSNSAAPNPSTGLC